MSWEPLSYCSSQTQRRQWFIHSINNYILTSIPPYVTHELNTTGQDTSTIQGHQRQHGQKVNKRYPWVGRSKEYSLTGSTWSLADNERWIGTACPYLIKHQLYCTDMNLPSTRASTECQMLHSGSWPVQQALQHDKQQNGHTHPWTVEMIPYSIPWCVSVWSDSQGPWLDVRFSSEIFL